jgi:hypothetical protein
MTGSGWSLQNPQDNKTIDSYQVITPPPPPHRHVFHCRHVCPILLPRWVEIDVSCATAECYPCTLLITPRCVVCREVVWLENGSGRNSCFVEGQFLRLQCGAPNRSPAAFDIEEGSMQPNKRRSFSLFLKDLKHLDVSDIPRHWTTSPKANDTCSRKYIRVWYFQRHDWLFFSLTDASLSRIEIVFRLCLFRPVVTW